MSQFTEKELVAFGNYVLSDERNESLVHETNKKEVTDADLANFKASADNRLDNLEQMESASTSKNDPFMLVAQEFRGWQRQWDAYDNKTGPKPKSVDGFIEELKEKFEVTLKQ